jgi:3-hydroxy-9,10-secoandrosta-1,3,5(10)-triene-9,17-dione monooxygenase
MGQETAAQSSLNPAAVSGTNSITETVANSEINILPHLARLKELGPPARLDRQVTVEAMDLIKASGFMRALLPKRWGGLEATPQEFFAAQIAIAEQDMSTAWVAGVVAVHAYQLALMSEQAKDDVYLAGPNTLISSSYNPAGARVEACDGGFMLHGSWGWSSGSEHCSWVLLGAVIPGEGYRTFLLPRVDYKIEDTWFVFGLQATGSNDIVIEQPVFVPDHRTHKQMDGFNCIHNQPNPMYNIPWAQIFTRVVSTSAIGALKHAVALFTDNAGASSTDPSKLMGDPDITRRVAETINDIDEVETILFRNFDGMMAAVLDGNEIAMIDRVRYRYQASLVIDRLGVAVDRLFDVAGGRNVFDGAPIQNIWRDLHIARSHVANNPTSFARNLGGMSLGAENADVFI